MGEGKKADEEGGRIVWQSKSYGKTVHGNCNPAKKKSSLIPAKKAALEAI